jgi:ketosteroid isomerase-like protein
MFGSIAAISEGNSMSRHVITDPDDLHPAWAERFNDQDLEGMLALAEPGSVFVPQPGVAVMGGDVAGAIKQFLSLRLPISMTTRHSFVVDDIALIIVDWTISGTGPDGGAVDLAGTTADVARRGDQGWRFAIDNPFGTA